MELCLNIMTFETDHICNITSEHIVQIIPTTHFSFENLVAVFACSFGSLIPANGGTINETFQLNMIIKISQLTWEKNCLQQSQILQFEYDFAHTLGP